MMEATNQITNVYTDMDVYDVNGDRIGSVQYVYYGTDRPLDTLPDDEATIEHLKEAMGGDKTFPQPIFNRLYQDGFVRVGRWFFQQDLFVLPYQIAHVAGEKVQLNCRINHLIRG